MAISINEITSGTALLINNEVFMVVEFQHVKPGKGSAFVRVKLKGVRTDQVLERTYRSSERLDDLILEEKRLQYQYRSDDKLNFMDISTYEEVSIPVSVLGDKEKFLLDNMEVLGMCWKDTYLKVDLPNFITVQITHTEPGIKGDSSRSGGKPATIETGATIQVPLFIDIGDKIKLDTRSGTYVERVK